ncbi:MAG: phenylacetate--CoA ligase family protein [Acidimicrobiia bacterium]
MSALGERVAMAVRLRRATGARRPAEPVEARLAALRRHAAGRSRFYRDLHAGLADAPLTALPPVTKETLVESFDDVVTDDLVRLADLRAFVEANPPGSRYLGRYRVAASSGSSGRPALFVFDGDEWLDFIAGSAWARSICGPLGGPPGRRLRSAKIASPSAWHMSLQVGSTLRDPRRPTLRLPATLPIEELVAELERWRPHVLTAYPSVLRLLAREQEAGHLTIEPRRVFSTAEPLSAATRRAVASAWGSEPFDQYMTTEASAVAAECPEHRGLHVRDDAVLVESVDADHRPVPAGMPGAKVLLTVLGSRTIPLIRYELNDSIVLSPEPCPCGRPSPLIAAVHGRERELLRLPGRDGEVAVHPVAFTSVLDPSPCAGWQVVRRPGGLAVRYTDPAGRVDEVRLRDDVAGAMERLGVTGVPVTVERVATLPAPAGGKAARILDETR